MPHAEFVGWQQFYGLEPWGLAVQDTMQANAVHVAANINRDAEQRPEPYRLRDFLLFSPPEPPREEPTVDGKTAAQWKMVFAAEALQANRQSLDS